MPFIPYSNEIHLDQPAITVDKQGRLCLNAALQRKLDCVDKEIELYLFFCTETRRIGISRTYTNGKPFKFDKSRGYATARNFLNHHDIEYQDGAVKYYYDGLVNGIMAFNAAQDYEPIRLSFKAEKNGNLERIGE